MEAILYVDDDVCVLEAVQRQCRKRHALVTATNGPEALELLRSGGPFAVIVSDMRMPGMDGIQLLSRAQEICPDTVRIMLTGAGDLQSAITAVNEGQIFRFLTKPCPPETLTLALEAGLAQHRLITAERELLEKTLKGSIRAMMDIMALSNPVAFAHAMRIRHYAVQMAQHLKSPDVWQIEVAAMLSQVGCVTLPPGVLEKAFAGEALTPQESEMYESHSQTGGQLIIHIPRMEMVARMIVQQQQPGSGGALPDREDSAYWVEVGAHILNVAGQFDLLLSRGIPPEKAKGMVAARQPRPPAAILEALLAVQVPELERVERMEKIGALRNGMVLAQDVRTKTGVLVVQKNQEITETLSQRLSNFRRQELIPDEIRVFVLRRKVSDM